MLILYFPIWFELIFMNAFPLLSVVFVYSSLFIVKIRFLFAIPVLPSVNLTLNLLVHQNIYLNYLLLSKLTF